MPPRTRTTAPTEGADDTQPRAEAACSHYLKQEDGTFVTYGRDSVLTADQMSAEAWAGYLADGRLIPTDRPAVRLDPEDGYYMPPVSPIHSQED